MNDLQKGFHKSFPTLVVVVIEFQRSGCKKYQIRYQAQRIHKRKRYFIWFLYSHLGSENGNIRLRKRMGKWLKLAGHRRLAVRIKVQKQKEWLKPFCYLIIFNARFSYCCKPVISFAVQFK